MLQVNVDNDGDVDMDDVWFVQDEAGLRCHDNNGDGNTNIDDLLSVIEG